MLVTYQNEISSEISCPNVSTANLLVLYTVALITPYNKKDTSDTLHI